MRPSIASIAISPILLLPALVSAVTYDCKNILVKNQEWDLSALDGPHSIVVEDTERHPSKSNTTWTIDICKSLKKPKEVPKDHSCPSYTRVCGITSEWDPETDPNVEHPVISRVIGVAGEYLSGGSLDPKFTPLKTSEQDIEGIEIELNGGKFDDRKQKAVVSFMCEPDWTGNEGSEEDRRRALGEREEDDDNDDDDNGGKDPSDRYKQDPKSALQFVSYGEEGEGKNRMDVLRLKWKTKYACQSSKGGSDDGKTAGWGFFTWFILILFLAIAAYLIFGSWLNYNRYGARGWDLLPHGDTIRDIPYLFKDWSRKVVDTVTGSHSRGGYSAV